MTSTVAISDVVSRIDQIQQQLQQLQSGALLDSVLGIDDDSQAGPGTTSTTDFSDALAQAQGVESGTASDAASSTLGTASLGTLYGSTGVDASTTLPAAADTLLTSAQQQFASTLSADTGLNPGVVSAWLLAEESGGAAQARQEAGNNDWLNIGYTDSGTYGSADSVWSDPVTAANATAAWLGGQDSIPGYGTASSGIQAILQTVGQTPAAQIAAVQGSGWASSGYPDLDSLYEQVTGA